METDTTLQQLLEETRKIYTLLADRTKEKQTIPSEIKLEGKEPEHVDTGWIMDYFNISRGTFYNEVQNKLLFPVLHIGKRPYYLKSEVIELMTKKKNFHLGFKKLNALLRKCR